MTQPPPVPPGTGTTHRRRVRRPRLALILALTGITVLGALVMMTLRLSHPIVGKRRSIIATTSPVTPRPHPIFPEVESRIFQVTEATGRVEAQRGSEWVLIAPGDVLTQDNLVRTGLGRAILKLGGNTEIELRDHVEVRLDSISRAGAIVDLRRGKVVAHVTRAGGRVAITSASTRTANEGAAPARFVVTADEHGRVSVATTEGSARFESAGRAVTVGAGTTTRAEPGRPPIDPEKISEDVFLSVTWPAGERHDEKVPVTGHVDPGSAVLVNGAPASIDGMGRFSSSVAVRIGQNPIEVIVEDAAGRLKSERRDIRKISTRPPDLVPVPGELWKK